MADTLGVMTAFPPKNSSMSPAQYDTSINNYLVRLQKLPASAWTQAVEKQSPLEILNPSRNSVAYLRSLQEHVSLVGKDKKRMEDWVNYATIFFASFDPVQVRYTGGLWRKMWERMADYLDKLGMMDLTPLSAALLRLDPSGGTLTSMHLEFLRECLSKATPSQALPILNNDIHALPQAASKGDEKELASDEHDQSNAFITLESGFTEKLKSEQVLEFWLLGAHVYIGIRSYDRARLFLELVMLYPTTLQATSALQIEAHKKWTLLGLVATGRPYPYPRTVDPAIWKNLKTMSKPYDALAESFERRDLRKYQAEQATAGGLWADDGNLGLVNEVGRALVRFRVADLQKTYAALPVARVATHLSFTPDETSALLQQMIQQGSIKATLEPGAILRFHSTSTSVDSSVDLEAQTKRIESLVAAVRDADRRLQMTKEYMAVLTRDKRAGPETDLADQMDLTWDTVTRNSPPGMMDDDGEEDIMA